MAAARRRDVDVIDSIAQGQVWTGTEARDAGLVDRLGTLDDPSSIRPVANIWSASAPDWACLDPGLPRIERQPPSPQPPAG